MVGIDLKMSLISFPNSGNTFYFRSRIPSDLREHFGGMKEFRLSLKCAIKSRSIKISRVLDRKVLRLYETIRQGMKPLTIEEIKEILRIEIRKQILHAHHVYEGTNRWSDSGVTESLKSVQLNESNLKEKLESSFRSYQGEIDSKLEEILTSLDIEVNKNSVDFKKLRNKFIDLYLIRYDWIKDLLNESGKNDSDFKMNAQQKLGLDLFPELMNPIIENLVPEPKEPYEVQRESTPISPAGKSSLSSNIDAFFERKRIEGKSVKEIGSDRTIAEDFVEIIGDIDFSRVTKKEVSHYIDIQTKLPTNRKKSPKYRDSNIQQLVEMNLSDEETQSPQNINKKLTKLVAFGNWGVRQGILSSNPFSGMKFSVKKQSRSRNPFTADELRKILHPETYFQYTTKFEHPFMPNRSTLQMPYYWIFLLGIFSGMRTNEMCQLRLIDIKKVSNIWFMFVENSEETKVKTESAVRKVPVHPQLIQLGFVDYVSKLKRSKKERLFWELKEERDGYASKVSRHFNERFLPTVGVWEKYTKVLYCTRHTFINKLYSEKVDENVIRSLIGHEKGFTMKHYGGEPFSPERLLEEISKVSYSKINWKRLKI